MKAILTAFVCLVTTLPALAKDAPRAPASASVLCGIVTKVGMTDGHSYLVMKDWDQRQEVRLNINLKGDSLVHALSGAHASLNSMGKVFFCTDRVATKKASKELFLAEGIPFYTSVYEGIE